MDLIATREAKVYQQPNKLYDEKALLCLTEKVVVYCVWIAALSLMQNGGLPFLSGAASSLPDQENPTPQSPS